MKGSSSYYSGNKNNALFRYKVIRMRKQTCYFPQNSYFSVSVDSSITFSEQRFVVQIVVRWLGYGYGFKLAVASLFMG